MDLSRREFMLTGLSTMATASDVSLQVDTQQNNQYAFQGVAHLFGPATARPAANGDFFDNKVAYAYIYEDHNGARSYITDDGDSWTPLNYIQQVTVTSAADLPEPTSGTHTLQGQTAYWFNGFVTSPYGLDISNGPVLLGRHASMDGFIHTGAQTAITGTNGGYFQDSLYVHAPGGQIWDLTGDQSTEVLVTDSAFSDAGNIGNIASLGTITGFRVPTFKNCNFEDFDGGLTFDGSPDKIFITTSPFRGVSASNVDILTLADTSDVGIVDFPGNYIKSVQNDTVVWRIESGGAPSEVFQYRGTTHDISVNKSNILAGPNANKDSEPYYVTQSYPLGSTKIIGEMHNTGESTITIGAQDTYTIIDATSVLDTQKRFVKAGDGQMEYVGSKDTTIRSNLTASFYGANGDIYTFAISKNGTIETQHTASVEGGGKNANIPVPANAVLDVTTNDIISIQVKNESSLNDPTILSYSFGAASGG